MKEHALYTEGESYLDDLPTDIATIDAFNLILLDADNFDLVGFLPTEVFKSVSYRNV